MLLCDFYSIQLTYVNANSRSSLFFFFIVQTLSFMHCTCNFICGLSDVIIKTFSQSVTKESYTIMKRDDILSGIKAYMSCMSNL